MENRKINVFDIIKTIGRVFAYALLIGLILICSFFAFYIAENIYAKFTNTKPFISLYVIVSPSMVPTINVNDVIIDTGVNNDSELKVDDIVTFYSNVINTGGYTITHRINEIKNANNEVRYYTKGDNNASVDVGFTTIDNIVGKVKWIIPKVGKMQSILASKWGWILIIFIPTLGIILSDIVKLIGLFRIKKELIEIPDLSNRIKKEEVESNKNIRVLVEKAERLNKDKEEENEEEESIK